MRTSPRKQIQLTTTGRRTGEARTVTLYAFEADEGSGTLVIVGSFGGASHDPAWVHNLRAQPRATVTLGRERRDVIAREVPSDEREPLWTLVCNAFPLYATYQRRTKRLIPLFVLGPSDA